MSNANGKVFMNEHSIVLVIFGTISILFLSTPLRILIELVLSMKRAGGSMPSKATINRPLMQLIADREARVGKAHPLIAHAQELWEAGVEGEVFLTLLSQKLDHLNSHSEHAVACLRNLAKYPPALGMIGTVIGMVGLFGSLSSDNKDSIGPNLANAMTATFFGLVLANGLIMPLADRLHIFHQASVQLNEHVYRVIMLIQRGYPEALLKKELHASVG
jgi:chemotaxis protein MotA